VRRHRYGFAVDGGALSVRRARRWDSVAIAFSADEVFEMGMAIEQNGEAFYRKAAGLARDARIKAVFTDLMKQEHLHYETFKMLRDKLPPKATLPILADPESEEYLYLDALVKSRLFNNVHEAETLAGKVQGEVEALRAALTFEKDTILFFLTMKNMTDERLGRGEIDRLIGEEHKHVVRISEAIKNASEKGATG
jgi:rubrerythrin